LANLAIVANMAKFCQVARGIWQLCECGEILPKCQTYANKLNTGKPTILVNLAIVANMAKFCQITKLMQIS